VKSPLLRRALLALGPPLGALAVRALASTLSITRDEQTVRPFWQAGAPVIYALWHGHILLPPLLYGTRRARVMASPSRDGELVTRYMRRFGLEAVRGSSSRRGSGALRLLARSLDEGRDVVVVPDGPRGPAQVAKPGIVRLARLSGAAIVPLAVGASSEWRLSSWDAFRIPRPFARCVARFGDPIYVPHAIDHGGEERARAQVEASLRALASAVDLEAREDGDAPLMYALYSVMLTLALAACAPMLALRRRRRGGDGRSFRQRFGHLEPGLPPEPRCWVHAVSVGEAAAAAPLVHGIRRRWPELSVVVTTVTPTGARLVTDQLGGLATHRYFPLDLPGPVRRALGAMRPRFFIGMETELWPNFLRALGARGIPSMIANGRLSDRSFRRYRLVRPLMARILARVSVFAMQSEEDARRIIALGARPERVVVTGNLKADLTAPPADIPWAALLALDDGAPVWIAGSTHRGEEALVLEVFQRLARHAPALRLVLAPRHPERAGEVERLVTECGLRPVRRSRLPGDRARDAVVILDTVGELADLYRLAAVVFVGGSLVPTGGHNLFEPALRRKPILCGPHTENFRESAELLVAGGGALVVRSALELEAQMLRLLGDPELRRRMGDAAFGAVEARQGAVGQTLGLVEQVLVNGGSPGGRR
jgi:3-deoxy-D-manno-octulosonic-acid transferase